MAHDGGERAPGATRAGEPDRGERAVRAVHDGAGRELCDSDLLATCVRRARRGGVPARAVLHGRWRAGVGGERGVRRVDGVRVRDSVVAECVTGDGEEYELFIGEHS